MNSKSLVAVARHWRERLPGKKSYLHRFSDSALHTTLMVAVVILATLVMIKVVEVGVTVWQLEKVVITGRPSGG
ncbi:hypothetical protein ABT392_19375 [Paucibacter sp. JuS9]|uniref:hypothetical protein n=1 Tax=Roseateles TaxID=93681 RepID=UPI002FE60A23